MPPTSTRRRFLKGATVAPVILTSSALTAAQEPEAPSVVHSLTDIVRRRYGKHLTETQIKSVQAAIQGDLASSEALKRVRLENGDEPAFVFVPDVD